MEYVKKEDLWLLTFNLCTYLNENCWLLLYYTAGKSPFFAGTWCFWCFTKSLHLPSKYWKYQSRWNAFKNLLKKLDAEAVMVKWSITITCVRPFHPLRLLCSCLMSLAVHFTAKPLSGNFYIVLSWNFWFCSSSN